MKTTRHSPSLGIAAAFMVVGLPVALMMIGG